MQLLFNCESDLSCIDSGYTPPYTIQCLRYITAILPALQDKCQLTYQVIYLLYLTTLTVIDG